MTKFDVIVLGIFAVSALIGLARGATRELTTMVALVAAAVLSMAARRWSAPIARHAIHAHWLADAVAVLAVFVALYIVLRLVGGMLTRRVRSTILSGPDRVGGAVFGAARAWVVVGGLALLLEAVTPLERMPPWITGARTYPLVTNAAGILRVFAPKGLKIAENALPPTASGDTRDVR